MRYALIVCDDEAAVVTSSERDERSAAFTAAEAAMQARGVLVSRERLRPTSASTTVRLGDAGVVIADGPFAETREQIAGFFIVDCADLDEAVELAQLIPAVGYGLIEVRPVWEM